ncbi:MAG: hypothetical protein Q8P18_21365 [Pseudomonadota bacterium]|nr:hypothetical protein [Pseudomonadota bacterium]
MRAVLSFGPLAFVASYLAAGLRATILLGRKPEVYESINDRWVELAWQVHSRSFIVVILALVVWPLIRRGHGNKTDLPEVFFIVGLSAWSVVMGFDLGGYMEWYRD